MMSNELKLINALKEIAKAEGVYSMDRLTHANNTIKNMKSISIEVLKEIEYNER
jgi:hypothetical protein